MVAKLIEPENSPYVMNKKGLSRLCSCFCLFAHKGICYGIACGGVLFLAIFVAVFGFPVWVSELFEKRMEARRKKSSERRQMNDNRQMNIE